MSDSVFNLLAPEVRRLVYEQGWKSLRPIQVAAIEAYNKTANDLLLIAQTAGGKTEAWLLPALSTLISQRLLSVQVLCISPLKALINDQYTRTEKLTKPLSIQVHRWHGDVDEHHKNALRQNPSGILIITPESIEAAIMKRPAEVAKHFKHLELVIIDEVHALLTEERGMHVRSLLSRLFDLIGSRPRLIGLSATIGDPKAAQIFLNPENPDSVTILGL